MTDNVEDVAVLNPFNFVHLTNVSKIDGYADSYDYYNIYYINGQNVKLHKSNGYAEMIAGLPKYFFNVPGLQNTFINVNHVLSITARRRNGGVQHRAYLISGIQVDWWSEGNTGDLESVFDAARREVLDPAMGEIEANRQGIALNNQRTATNSQGIASNKFEIAENDEAIEDLGAPQGVNNFLEVLNETLSSSS